MLRDSALQAEIQRWRALACSRLRCASLTRDTMRRMPKANEMISPMAVVFIEVLTLSARVCGSPVAVAPTFWKA